MNFFSLRFLLFFLALAPALHLTPARFRWAVMLLASYYFIGCWLPAYTLLLAATTLIDQVCARRIAGTANRGERKRYLLLSLIVNFGLLSGFKFLFLLNRALQAVSGPGSVNPAAAPFNLVVPLGLSYFTLKKAGYVIDVYRGHREVEAHLGRFALFVAFFPEIAAGPIDRAGALMPQLSAAVAFDYPRVRGGMKLVAWGLFKKIAIADPLAILVKTVFDQPSQFDGPVLLLAVLAFSVQIYADFSGYTDMAIGIAQVLGYRLPDNFDRPYAARSIGDFWRRWHISLTNWLRDYLFLPLAYAVSRKIRRESWGGLRAEAWTYTAAISVTMLLCGLWHGVAWTFLAWGGLHGVYLMLSRLTRRARKKWRRELTSRLPFLKPLFPVLGTLLTFSMVSTLWIFFRARSLADAFYIVSHLFASGKTRLDAVAAMHPEWPAVMAALALLVLLHRLQPHSGIRDLLAARPALLRWFLYVLIGLAILNLGGVHETPFIYVQY